MLSLERLKGGLVVSCQPVTGGPMDQIEVILAMAIAAVEGGARGLRVEGAANVAAVCKAVDVPVIGIIKTEQGENQAKITAHLSGAKALIESGAKLVAVEVSQRHAQANLVPIFNCLIDANVAIMADCATFEDGERALALGASIIGTTLSGYTPDTQPMPAHPNYDLVSRFVELCHDKPTLVMAEGRFNTPHSAKKAIQLGADCVTVGSAITRVEHIVGWFNTAIAEA